MVRWFWCKKIQTLLNCTLFSPLLLSSHFCFLQYTKSLTSFTFPPSKPISKFILSQNKRKNNTKPWSQRWTQISSPRWCHSLCRHQFFHLLHPHDLVVCFSIMIWQPWMTMMISGIVSYLCGLQLEFYEESILEVSHQRQHLYCNVKWQGE